MARSINIATCLQVTLSTFLLVAQFGPRLSRADDWTGEKGIKTQVGSAEPVLDRYGDPMPRGAVTRIGTLRFRHTDSVTSLAFSREGTRLTSASAQRAFVWGVPDGRPQASLSFPWSGEGGPAVSPDGSLVAYVLPKATLCVSEIVSGKRRWSLPSNDELIHGLSFSNDGRWSRLFRPSGSLVSLGRCRGKARPGVEAGQRRTGWSALVQRLHARRENTCERL